MINYMKCPYCGKKINAGSLLAHQRMAKLTKLQKRAIITKMVEARKKKAVDKLLAHDIQ